MAVQPLEVFIDTSILSAAPRRNTAAFRSIERLARKGDIVIHVSAVAVREFASQEEAHFETAVTSTRKALQDIRRRLPDAATGVVSALDPINAAVESLSNELVRLARGGLSDWLTSVNAVVHESLPAHGKQVLDGYFEGSLPFKTKKSREDFPDAFIFQSLKELTSVKATVHAVIADVQLRAAASTLRGVVPHVSLDDLVKSECFQELIRDANTKENLELLWVYLRNHPLPFDNVIEENLVEAIVHKKLESAEISDDNETALITSVDEPHDIAFQTDEAEYYGDGNVRVPFTALVEVLGSYYIYKADYYALPDHRARRIFIGDWNDHYFEAEENFTVRITGALTVAFGEATLAGAPMNVPQLESALAEAEGEIDEVSDIELDAVIADER